MGNLKQQSVRKYLMLAAYGTMLLLSSTLAVRIISSPYPPFGIATITLLSIASYSMLIGIYFSAVFVSQDTKLRKAITKSSNISKQLRFMKNIGRSQMEDEIQNCNNDNFIYNIHFRVLVFNTPFQYRSTIPIIVTTILRK